MGATLEINIYSAEKISLYGIMNSIEKYDKNISILDAVIIDNWEYENEISVNIIDEDINELVDKGKIILIDLCIQEDLHIGIHQYIENNMYVTILWLNTLKLQYLDKNYVDETNINFYNLVTESIIKSGFYQQKTISVAIGVESTIINSKDMLTTINESLNVVRWIVKEKHLGPLDDYYYFNDSNKNIEIYTKMHN